MSTTDAKSDAAPVAQTVSKAVPPSTLGEILITGCSSGIGRALALEFRYRGYDVLATARKRESLADLEPLGIATAALDVDDPASIAALELSERPIGMLVNNAGYGLMGAMLDVAPAALRAQFETNVVAVLAMTQAAAPAMLRAKRGRIVNISSVSGVLTTPFAGSYCASKAAVNAMSDALRLELRPFGIDVITVQPGAIRSSFGERATSTIASARPSSQTYSAVADAVAARAVIQQRGAMPAEAFARRLVDELIATHPRSLVRIGPYSRYLPTVRRWLPEPLRDAMLSRRFKLAKLRPARS